MLEKEPPCVRQHPDGWHTEVMRGRLPLTCIGGSCGGAVEEAGRAWHAQVGHARPVAVHGGSDAVVVGLLRCGARDVATRGHTVGVT